MQCKSEMLLCLLNFFILSKEVYYIFFSLKRYNFYIIVVQWGLTSMSSEGKFSLGFIPFKGVLIYPANCQNLGIR